MWAAKQVYVKYKYYINIIIKRYTNIPHPLSCHCNPRILSSKSHKLFDFGYGREKKSGIGSFFLNKFLLVVLQGAWVAFSSAACNVRA